MNTYSSFCHKDEPCSVTADGKCDASQAQQPTNLRQIVKNAILANSHPAEGWHLAFNDAEEIDIVANQVASKLPDEFGDPYQGAREDLAIWKKRALEAESKLQSHEQQEIICFVGAMAAPYDEMKNAAHELAKWVSAALDDPLVCDEYKLAINNWFDASMPFLPPAPEGDNP